MPPFEPTLFSDVADALSISSPVLVEKDGTDQFCFTLL